MQSTPPNRTQKRLCMFTHEASIELSFKLNYRTLLHGKHPSHQSPMDPNGTILHMEMICHLGFMQNPISNKPSFNLHSALHKKVNQ